MFIKIGRMNVFVKLS